MTAITLDAPALTALTDAELAAMWHGADDDQAARILA